MGKNGFEIKRKIFHINVGIIGLLLLTYNIITPLYIFIILIFVIFLGFLSLKIKNPLFLFVLDNFERESYKQKFPGRALIFGIAGSLLVLELFSKDIALASITILIFADPISHLVGKYFGKTKSPLNKEKNIEGHISAALISSLLAVFFVPFYLAFLGALTAMLFELLTIKIQDINIDDNLLIPLTAGTAMFLIVKFFLF